MSDSSVRVMGLPAEGVRPVVLQLVKTETQGQHPSSRLVIDWDQVRIRVVVIVKNSRRASGLPEAFARAAAPS
ncbi:hypothetical protein GCM10028790_16100 [Micromonospora taraxaci]